MIMILVIYVCEISFLKFKSKITFIKITDVWIIKNKNKDEVFFTYVLYLTGFENWFATLLYSYLHLYIYTFLWVLKKILYSIFAMIMNFKT